MARHANGDNAVLTMWIALPLAWRRSIWFDKNGEHAMITPMEEYQFDLHGYSIMRGALDLDHIRAMNDWIDALPPLAMSQWHDNVYVHTYGGIDGMNLQDIIEGG